MTSSTPPSPFPDPMSKSAPDWLEKAWAGAKRRGVDAFTPSDIEAEIAAHRDSRKDDAPGIAGTVRHTM